MPSPSSISGMASWVSPLSCPCSLLCFFLSSFLSSLSFPSSFLLFLLLSSFPLFLALIPLFPSPHHPPTFTAGVGMGLAYVPPVATLLKWFPDRRGMAAGLTIMGFGGGALVTSPILVGKRRRLLGELGSRVLLVVVLFFCQTV